MLRLDRARVQARRGIDPSVDGVGTEAMDRIAPNSRRPRPDDLLGEVMREELRPIVREQITNETLHAIQNLVKATPIMVEALIRDMQHPDPIVRGKAVNTVARYTLGHNAIVTPPEQTAAKMTVVFPGMVRPGQETEAVEVPAEPSKPRECNSCHQTKDADQFVEDSDLCRSCFEARRAQLAELVGGDDGVA